MNQAILKGTKVLELASVLAGPSVGLFFAELGAEVIKVENKKVGGDVTRTWRLASEPKENPVSAYYASVNWNKTVLFLDLSNPEDLAKVDELVKTADVVLANFRASSAQKLGVDYNRFKTLNPRLIYGNITGFGEESDRVAFDVVLQAESGFMYMNGQSSGPATKMPVALIDVLAAHQLKEGVLLALLQREKTGQGAYVSVSLLEAALASLVNQATNWLMAGHIPQRMGSLHPNIAPYGEIFETADAKLLVLAIGSDKQFQQLCVLLGCIELADSELFVNNVARVRNRQALEATLQPYFAKLEAKYLLEESLLRAIPLGQIRNMQEVFELAEAQQMILEEMVDGQLTKRLASVAFVVE